MREKRKHCPVLYFARNYLKNHLCASTPVAEGLYHCKWADTCRNRVWPLIRAFSSRLRAKGSEIEPSRGREFYYFIKKFPQIIILLHCAIGILIDRLHGLIVQLRHFSTSLC